MPLSGSVAVVKRFAPHLEAAGHGELVQARTGLKIDTYFPASKLTWLLENRPDIRQKLESWRGVDRHD